MKTQEFLLSSIKCWFCFHRLLLLQPERRDRYAMNIERSLTVSKQVIVRMTSIRSCRPVFVARFDLNKRRIQVSSTNRMMFVYAIAGSTTYGSIVHLWSSWISLILLRASIRWREEKNLFFFLILIRFDHSQCVRVVMSACKSVTLYKFSCAVHTHGAVDLFNQLTEVCEENFQWNKFYNFFFSFFFYLFWTHIAS